MSSNWHKNIQTTKSNCLKNIKKYIYNSNQNETQDINQLNQLRNKPVNLLKWFYKDECNHPIHTHQKTYSTSGNSLSSNIKGSI